eukprot:3935452-Rhodomonas_salina.1
MQYARLSPKYGVYRTAVNFRMAPSSSTTSACPAGVHAHRAGGVDGAGRGCGEQGRGCCRGALVVVHALRPIAREALVTGACEGPCSVVARCIGRARVCPEGALVEIDARAPMVTGVVSRGACARVRCFCHCACGHRVADARVAGVVDGDLADVGVGRLVAAAERDADVAREDRARLALCGDGDRPRGGLWAALCDDLLSGKLSGRGRGDGLLAVGAAREVVVQCVCHSGERAHVPEVDADLCEPARRARRVGEDRGLEAVPHAVGELVRVDNDVVA